MKAGNVVEGWPRGGRLGPAPDKVSRNDGLSGTISLAGKNNYRFELNMIDAR